MYLRLVHAKFAPDSLDSIRRVYEETIIPQLQKTAGCLYVCLLRNERQPDEGISMTLWDTYASVQAYEKSGKYDQLLTEVLPYLSDATDYRIEMTEELKLEYKQVQEKPVVKSYAAIAQKDDKLTAQAEHPFLLMRIMSLKIQPGKMDEFREIYTNEIIPALREVRGCRNAFLSDSIEEKDEVLSLTIWESKQDLVAYEKSGLYKKITKRVRHTFAELYQWKLEHQKEKTGQLVTSEDLKVKSYSIVIDRNFE